MTVFRMPSLGADMEDGTLVEWLVSPGDRVASGDVVAVVETHKGAIEIEIFESGVIERLEVDEGTSVPVGNPLARLRTDGEPSDLEEPGTEEPDSKIPVELASDTGPGPGEDRATAVDSASRPDAMEAPARSPAGRRAASPAARRRASQAELDLTGVAGSGPNGAILLADVEAHLQNREQTPAEPGPAPESASAAGVSGPRGGKPGLDIASMRQAIAAAMSRSMREIPHYYLQHSIDLQASADWLAEHNDERDPDQRLLMVVLFMKATALAVARTPELNGHYENDRFRAAQQANVGMAISLRGGGLIAPAVADVAGLSLDALMVSVRDLVARTRTGRLKNSEMTGGTITVSSMGDQGIDSLYGVIYPPQVALLGFGTPAVRPRVVEGEIRPRMTVSATLAADHRVSDGRRGARLLSDIAGYLQEPEAL